VEAPCGDSARRQHVAAACDRRRGVGKGGHRYDGGPRTCIHRRRCHVTPRKFVATACGATPCGDSPRRQHVAASRGGSMCWQSAIGGGESGTTRLQRVAASCGDSVWRHRAATACGGTTRLQRVAAPCGGSVWRHRAAAACGGSVRRQRAAAPCGDSVWRHRAATACGGTVRRTRAPRGMRGTALPALTPACARRVCYVHTARALYVRVRTTRTRTQYKSLKMFE
jgi:hypothetical protein